MNQGVVMSRTKFGKGVCYCLLDLQTLKEYRPYYPRTPSQAAFIHGAFEHTSYFAQIQPFNMMQWDPRQFPKFKPRITHPEDCGSLREMTPLGQVGKTKMIDIIKTKLTLPTLREAFPLLENYYGEKWATSDQAQNPRSIAFVKVKNARIAFGKAFIETYDGVKITCPYVDASSFAQPNGTVFNEPTIRFSLSNPYKPDHEEVHRCYLQCSMIIP